MVKYTKWIEAAPDDLIAEVAVRSLQSRLEPVQDYVVLAANKPDKDAEYVHQMRVWSRRAVARARAYWSAKRKRSKRSHRHRH